MFFFMICVSDDASFCKFDTSDNTDSASGSDRRQVSTEQKSAHDSHIKATSATGMCGQCSTCTSGGRRQRQHHRRAGADQVRLNHRRKQRRVLQAETL